MSNPTTYFGWQMPEPTDLVTDLPADFEVFGQAVDTDFQDLLGGTTGQILSKTSATDLDFTWINNDQGDITGVTAGTGISGGGTSGTVTVTNSMATAITTSGDLVQGTGNGTFARLGTGTNGQYLTTNGTTNSWGTISAGGDTWTLLNSGGTSLTAAATITVSGISGKEKLFIILEQASTVDPAPGIGLRFNTDTGSNYYSYGGAILATTSYSAGDIVRTVTPTDTYATFAIGNSTSSLSNINGYCLLTGCASSSSIKMYQINGGASSNGYSYQMNFSVGGYYNSNTAITSVSAFSTVGNFDNGKIYVYANS